MAVKMEVNVESSVPMQEFFVYTTGPVDAFVFSFFATHGMNTIHPMYVWPAIQRFGAVRQQLSQHNVVMLLGFGSIVVPCFVFKSQTGCGAVRWQPRVLSQQSVWCGCSGSQSLCVMKHRMQTQGIFQGVSRPSFVLLKNTGH